MKKEEIKKQKELAKAEGYTEPSGKEQPVEEPKEEVNVPQEEAPAEPNKTSEAPAEATDEPKEGEMPAEEPNAGEESPEGEKPKKTMMALLMARYPDVKGEKEDDYYDNVEGDYKEHDGLRKSRDDMNNLISDDPRVAKMLTGLASGKDDNGEDFSIEKFFIENYGDELQSAANSEEAMALIQEKKQKELEAQARREENNKMAEENLKKADEALDEAVKEGGYSNDEAKNMVEYLYGDNGLIVRSMRNELTKDDFTGLLLASNAEPKMKGQYDKGYKDAMNTRIDMEKHQKGERKQMPAVLSGGSTEPEENTNPTVAAFGRMAKKKFNY